MKITINNGMYLKINIDKTRNAIRIEKYEKNQVLETRLIDEKQFIDIYNLVIYAQDNNIEIYQLWNIKEK